jgi:hypothetical protein
MTAGIALGTARPSRAIGAIGRKARERFMADSPTE